MSWCDKLGRNPGQRVVMSNNVCIKNKVSRSLANLLEMIINMRLFHNYKRRSIYCQVDFRSALHLKGGTNFETIILLVGKRQTIWELFDSKATGNYCLNK